MKFRDTKGREHSIDIRPSRWPRKEAGEGRGKFQSVVGEIITRLYPSYFVLEEFPCKGDGLYLDFFIPNKQLAIEVQGQQHEAFNSFFHRSKGDFLAQRLRDKRKQEWCEINNIRLVKIRYGESEENIIKALR